MGQYFSPRKRLHQISNFAAIKKQLSIENNLLRFKPSEILKSYKTPSRIDIKVENSTLKVKTYVKINISETL